MNALQELFEKGGPVILALILLSIMLYERCFYLLLFLRRCRNVLNRLPMGEAVDLSSLQFQQKHLKDIYRQNMIKIRAMIAAAPLLGLLGTVIGMVNTFESLSNRIGEKTIKGLSDGISMALITTETGLAIAIPAMIIIYYSHRQLNQAIRILIKLEGKLRGEAMS